MGMPQLHGEKTSPVEPPPDLGVSDCGRGLLRRDLDTKPNTFSRVPFREAAGDVGGLGWNCGGTTLDGFL